MTLKNIDINVNRENIDQKIIELSLYIRWLQADPHKNRVELFKCLVRRNNYEYKNDFYKLDLLEEQSQ